MLLWSSITKALTQYPFVLTNVCSALQKMWPLCSIVRCHVLAYWPIPVYYYKLYGISQIYCLFYCRYALLASIQEYSHVVGVVLHSSGCGNIHKVHRSVICCFSMPLWPGYLITILLITTGNLICPLHGPEMANGDHFSNHVKCHFVVPFLFQHHLDVSGPPWSLSSSKQAAELQH